MRASCPRTHSSRMAVKKKEPCSAPFSLSSGAFQRKSRAGGRGNLLSMIRPSRLVSARERRIASGFLRRRCRTLHGGPLRRLAGAGRGHVLVGSRSRSPVHAGTRCRHGIAGTRRRRGSAHFGTRSRRRGTDFVPHGSGTIVRIGPGAGLRRNAAGQKKKTTYGNGQSFHDMPPRS